MNGYRFDISYPADEHSLRNLQQDILRTFPKCDECEEGVQNLRGKQYHSTVYKTDDPQDIPRVASSLQNVDSRIFVGYVDRHGQTIYYHPVELASLNPEHKAAYEKLMQHMPQIERVVHDYLTNLYHGVPL